MRIFHWRLELHDADRKMVQVVDIFGAVACADTTSTLIEIPIGHIFNDSDLIRRYALAALDLVEYRYDIVVLDIDAIQQRKEYSAELNPLNPSVATVQPTLQ
jgi:hypothetical protein